MARPIYILDPQEHEETEPIVRPAPLPGLAGRRIALLDNGKPGSRHLLQALGEHLARRHAIEVGILASKPSAGRGVEDELAERLRIEADGVVTGIGD